jgi:hypothetical protein
MRVEGLLVLQLAKKRAAKERLIKFFTVFEGEDRNLCEPLFHCNLLLRKNRPEKN